MEYIIQENVFRERHYDDLAKALDRLELPYTTVRIFPFVNKIVALSDIKEESYNVDDLPEYKPKSNKLFVFGAIKLARIIADKGWVPGSMMNSNHNFEVYSKYYGENLLNYDSQILKVGDRIDWKSNEVKFIRPTEDTKTFTGKLFMKPEWEDTVNTYLHNFRSDRFNEETPIQVSTPKKIYKEIRFWIVGGKIITGSQYKLGNNVAYDNVVETEAIKFAQIMVNKFQLADAFVIDVCLTDKGWKIVECGCINACGFYKADLQSLIMSIEDHFNPIEMKYGDIHT